MTQPGQDHVRIELSKQEEEELWQLHLLGFLSRFSKVI
jgi:hypothetical protein